MAEIPFPHYYNKRDTEKHSPHQPVSPVYGPELQAPTVLVCSLELLVFRSKKKLKKNKIHNV